MKDYGTHLALFAIVGTAIVVLNAVFAEPDEARALRSLPKRLLWFFAGCGILVAIVLVLEHTLASVK